MNLTQTEIEQKISSCIINKKTITKIIEIIETEINKIPIEDKKYVSPSLDIRIESDKRKTTVHASNEFDLQEIPKDLKMIRLHFHWFKEDMQIEINIGFEDWHTPKIEISGNNSNWVNGVLGDINDILTQNPTKNDVFHNNHTKIPIYLAIFMVVGFGIYLILPMEDPFSEGEPSVYLPRVVVAFLISSLVTLFFTLIFSWLFPHVEFEDRGIQRKIRKIVLFIIGTVIFGIIATGLYEYFTNLNS